MDVGVVFLTYFGFLLCSWVVGCQNKQPKQSVFRTDIPRTTKCHSGRHPGSQASVRGKNIGNGPNTVSGSTGSNSELSEFFGAH